MAGDPLQVNEDGCKDTKGNFVVRFYKKFLQTIQAQRNVGTGRDLSLRSAVKVNKIVYWKVEEGKEVRVVLPDVSLK